MGFLAPVALSLAALSVPILAFYMLKLRRREQIVSSTMLWQQVIRDQQANAPWQRLRRNLLLLLQLVILLTLVMALARPYSEISRLVQGNIVVLLDASASMQATDVSPSRFEVARSGAKQLIDSLGPNDTMTLIAVGDMPRVLSSLTNDRAVLRQALATAQSTNTVADWEAAAILAASSARQAQRTTTVVFSDGGLPPGIPDLPGEVRYVPIGTSAENQSIRALAVRDDPQGPQAFLRVSNNGTQPVTSLVEVYVDGTLFDARTLSLSPRTESSISLKDLPLDTRQVEARLADADALAIDNVAWAVRSPGERATVLLATPGNTFLERAIGLMPHLDPIMVRVTNTLTNARIVQPATPPTLYVFDGVLPEHLPETGNLFFIDPPASTGLFAVAGTLTRTQVTHIEAKDSLLRYVDLDDLLIARARAIVSPSWARAVVAAEGGPLLLAGEVNGRRVAILTFDLHQSNLPLQVAFPILIANLSTWLAPTSAIDIPAIAGSPSALHPGTPVMLRPHIGTTEITVRTPSEKEWTYLVEGSRSIPFAETYELGVYTVEQQSAEKAVQAHFAVNLFSELESHIAPQDTIAVGASPVVGEAEGAAGQREWWRWLALIGLIVLMIEWIAHWRGQTSMSLRQIFWPQRSS